ncbi:MAG: hypothetical protein VX874_11890 [Pseudomonadota bacterium]|nr:hypothetical protein [Pseudomonadota bacterium]
MRFIPLFLAMLGLSALPAAAQDWSFDPDVEGEVRAVACPLEEDETGNYMCLMVGCDAGQPLRWRVVAAGGDLPDPLRINMFVDEEPSGFLSLRQTASDVPLDYVAQVDPDREVRLLEALRAGGGATMVLDPDGAAIERALSLRGSGRAIASAMEACPMRAPAVEDPVASVLSSLEAECKDLGGVLEMVGGFERAEDLDGDGRDDLIIEYGGAPCTTALSLHCGSGGCVSDIYMARDQGYVRAWSDVVRDVLNEDGPGVAISVHGSACDLAGAQNCVLRVDLSGESAVVVETVGGEDADSLIEALGGVGPVELE